MWPAVSGAGATSGLAQAYLLRRSMAPAPAVSAPRRARYKQHNDVEEDFRVAHVLDLTLENPARPPPDHRST